MACARLRVRSSSPAALPLVLLLLLLAPAFLPAGAAGDEPQTTLEVVRLEVVSSGQKGQEGRSLPPAKLARPLRILAGETVPAMRKDGGKEARSISPSVRCDPLLIYPNFSALSASVGREPWDSCVPGTPLGTGDASRAGQHVQLRSMESAGLVL